MTEIPPNGDWIPGAGDRSPRSAAQRRKLIAKWAGQGYSSRQMAARLGIGEEGTRVIARKTGVVIAADTVIGRSRKPQSARIVAQTAAALEAMALGLDLVDPGDLDPAQARQWAASLTASIRKLTGFVKTMRENTR